jgi:hypothetical protein
MKNDTNIAGSPEASTQTGLFAQRVRVNQAKFLGAMFVSKYLLVVSGLQGISGALLLINRYVPLALTILGPIIVNILLFHGLMNPAGIGLAAFVTIFWGVVLVSVRSAFAGIFEARVETKTFEVRRQAHVMSPA